ncbi:hypothetical protein [Thiofilum flexile]|uniref:hypothetical protein n=1 Tax=Thiofilum flexile TaxID=125627 RepID=UPI00036ABF21|nr:hypothetical protein [Thiofilum flexile]
MALEIIYKNLFESSEEGIILTIDGAAKGLEGNLARAFARLYPDVWDDIEYTLNYPIPLGVTKIYPIHPDYECKYAYCFIASTLHHLETLSEPEKLSIQTHAFRQVLSLAEAKGIKTIATAVMVGGWRLDLLVALDNMLKTYFSAALASTKLPLVKLYILSKSDFTTVSVYIRDTYSHATITDSSIQFT